MKAKQMAILTAAVVALVIVVTLMKVGLRGRGDSAAGQTGEKVRLDEPHLTFPVSDNFPKPKGPQGQVDPGLRPDLEMGIDGHNDYWFTNNQTAPVDLFVVKVSCNKCLRVKVGLAPQDGSAEQVAGKAPTPGPDVAWETLETEEVKTDAHGFTVPPNRSGWVRLTWKDEEAGAKLLSADLRTTSARSQAPPIRLQYGAFFVEPVRVLPEKKELSVDTLFSNDKASQVVWFTVFSSTRPHFTLEPESPEDQKSHHPFVTCGPVKALNDEQCRSLENEYKVAFLCAYRVPVTVWEHLPDGSQHALGPFRTGVALKSDVLKENLALYVLGTVRGGLKVVGDENVEDRVVFGNFRRDIDAVKTVRVETPPGTTLQLYKKPDFMEAELKDESNGAGQLWGLTLTIRANTISGHFPRADDPSLSDSAIYLRANERPLRIPVSGTASQR